jgi:hypothetical protein
MEGVMAEDQEEKKKSDEEILESVPPGQKRDDAKAWLEQQVKLSGEWGKVQNGEQADQDILKETPRTEFHSLGAMGHVLGHHVDQQTIYHQAREVATKNGDTDLMDSYLPLVMAREMVDRFRDGRLILMGVHPQLGPILAGTGSDSFREKQDKNKKVKQPGEEKE